MPVEDAGKARQLGAFSSLFVRRSLWPDPRGARAGVAAVPAVSVCAMAFTETAGAGISAAVGAVSAGPRYRSHSVLDLSWGAHFGGFTWHR